VEPTEDLCPKCHVALPAAGHQVSRVLGIRVVSCPDMARDEIRLYGRGSPVQVIKIGEETPNADPA
jgi:hypothetical protein